MSDDRNKDLIKIISCIFGKKHTGINKDMKILHDHIIVVLIADREI